MKRFLSLLLAALMIAACVPAMADEAFSTEGYVFHVAEAPVTYKVAIKHNVLTNPNEEDPYVQMLEERTGVHFEFEVISSSDVATRVQLILAGEDYPDAMSGALLSESQIFNLGTAGILVNLKDYMNEEYMPNLMRDVELWYNDLLTAITFEDGNIYVLPNCETNFYDTYAGVLINTEWLDKLGIAMPTTLDEFTDMLVAFKDNDMNDNGDASDEIPLAFATGRYGISSWFGVSDGMIYVDDTAIFCPITEGWREYVRYMRKLWELGVMDVEAFTQDSTTFAAKGQQYPTLYGAVLSQAADYFTTADRAELYQPMLPVETGTERSGVIKQRVTGKYYNLRQGVVFNNGQDLKTLLGWFDNIYDPYYGQIASKGFLGMLVETEDHKLEYCPIEDVPEQYTNWTDWMVKTHFQQWPLALNMDYSETFSNTGVIYQMKLLTKALSPYFINEVMPFGYAYSEQQAVYDEYLPDINKLVSEKFAAWVTGEADVDADWDAYVEQLKSLHVEELVAAYQTQYDRLTGK